MLKIGWLYNLGPVLIVWMVFMLGHASVGTVTIACAVTYTLGIFLDILLWAMGIPNPYRKSIER